MDILSTSNLLSHVEFKLDANYLTLEVGGPDRPPSKRMQEQMRLEDQERRKLAREGRTNSNLSQSSTSQEGYWSYMSRQVQERTERLGLAGDSMDRLEENSSGWAKDVNKYVQNQKKKAILGGKFFDRVDKEFD